MIYSKLQILGENEDKVLQTRGHLLKWENCVKCSIGEWSHSKVLGRGALPCDLLFIGEGPGKTEDMKGVPFIGKAGRTLDKWVERMEARAFSEEMPGTPPTCAVTNIVACRPTNAPGGRNRAPYPNEISNCSSRLAEFMAIAAPKMIVMLGATARNNPPECYGLPVLQLFHPAYINYNGGESSKASYAESDKLIEFVHKNWRPQ